MHEYGGLTREACGFLLGITVRIGAIMDDRQKEFLRTLRGMLLPHTGLEKQEVADLARMLKKYLQYAKKSKMPLYSSKYSRKDYTLQQLFAILCLKEYLGMHYYCSRGLRFMEDLLSRYDVLRKAIKLNSVPSHSTLSRQLITLCQLHYDPHKLALKAEKLRERVATVSN